MDTAWTYETSRPTKNEMVRDLIRCVGPTWSHIPKDRKLWKACRDGFLLRERERRTLTDDDYIYLSFFHIIIVIISSNKNNRPILCTISNLKQKKQNKRNPYTCADYTHSFTERYQIMQQVQAPVIPLSHLHPSVSQKRLIKL